MTLAAEAGLPQTYRGPLVGVRTQSSSLRLLFGGSWPRTGGFGVSTALGGGITIHQATPLESEDSMVRLRTLGARLGAGSEAELGVEIRLASLLLTLGPTVAVHFNHSHFDLAYDPGQADEPQRVVEPWQVIPGGQVVATYRHRANDR